MARKPEGKLRRGWTTGACATAATRAAFTALLTGSFPDPVVITLPRGQKPAFALARQRLEKDYALAGIVKDAGDDPDVTHGALIIATVRKGPRGTGAIFRAGEGVGKVTKPGLPVPVGDPAINPVPRAMMRDAVMDVAMTLCDRGDVEVEISIPGGSELAQRTWNPRLGIEGGLSILGTTGVVIPYSCSAWIHSIHRGIDVARAMNLEHVAGCTGSTSEQATQAMYGLPDTAMLDMGDFAGGLLKYLRRHPLPNLSIGGGFAKISKLAAGHLDLHSGRSQVDFDELAEWAIQLGADHRLEEHIRTANTAKQVLTLATGAGLALADTVANRAKAHVLRALEGRTKVEVLIFNGTGQLVGRSSSLTEGAPRDPT